MATGQGCSAKTHERAWLLSIIRREYPLVASKSSNRENPLRLQTLHLNAVGEPVTSGAVEAVSVTPELRPTPGAAKSDRHPNVRAHQSTGEPRRGPVQLS